jgi:hypothetical protein
MGYYRRSTLEVLNDPPIPPLSIIAAEHTAQIGTAQDGDTYSLAEEHELLFQDVNLGRDQQHRLRPAIDVLSCTTTMEVGIDIGQLSGVALRNMPPGRANYQQRAGRAGRRGNAVASVIALAGADSHDNHFFANPEGLVRGAPPDPTLALDNEDIARRHVLAYLLQCYLHERVSEDADEQSGRLFEVLGEAGAFRDGGGRISRDDFARWLSSESAYLRGNLLAWLPSELADDARCRLVEGIAQWPLEKIEEAIRGVIS